MGRKKSNGAQKKNAGGGNKGKKGKAESSGGGNKSGSGKQSSKSSRKSNRAGGAGGKFSADVLNDEAMLDAYYTCHNVMHLLHCRGFPWPDAPKKKKKSKK
ncbi:hypothetical protein QAD02_024110 [Eretmocerus hayati]|uniref:Uncharacterized protein n=1 Tax=Eretmocerus hayati TaxID=131215 RepID=A0ACC2PXJ0_9HYME|nr:hypothetical protein QAD02_024110 [Eretmocerus hayati]